MAAAGACSLTFTTAKGRFARGDTKYVKYTTKKALLYQRAVVQYQRFQDLRFHRYNVALAVFYARNVGALACVFAARTSTTS